MRACNNRVAKGVNDEIHAGEMVGGVVNKGLTYRMTASLRKRGTPARLSASPQKEAKDAQEERAELTSEKQFKRFQEAAKEHEIEKRLPKTEQDFIDC